MNKLGEIPLSLVKNCFPSCGEHYFPGCSMNGRKNKRLRKVYKLIQEAKGMKEGKEGKGKEHM